MTTEELLSLLQFNVRGITRTLPQTLGSVGELQHLLGLYAGIEAGEVEILIGHTCGPRSFTRDGPRSFTREGPRSVECP